MPLQVVTHFSLRAPYPTLKKPGSAIKIQPNGTHTQGINFTCRASEQGVFKYTLHFNFSNFVYEHHIVINVLPESVTKDLELMKPEAAYVAPVLPEQPVTLPIVLAFPAGRVSKLPGVALYTTNSRYTGSRELHEYAVPTDIHAKIEGRKGSSFNPWKTQNNWSQRMHELLWLEEAQQAKLTRAYDLHGIDAELVKSFVDENENTIYLPEPLMRVPCANLAEKRPSVQRADRVYAWAAQGAKQQYEGWVHRVEGAALLIVFSEDFHKKHPAGTKINMRFDVDRLSARLMHRAVDDTQLESVWPSQLSEEAPEMKAAVDEALAKMTSASLAELNEPQRKVIAQLLTRTHGSAPYLMFGPFGTGKTRTLIEFLRKLVAAPGAAKGGKKGAPAPGAARVLVCSPSNSSVDKYITALKELLGPEAMLRVQAPHRLPGGYGPLKAYSHVDPKTGLYALPQMAELLKKQVVVSTTRSASMLVSAAVPKGHFTHIIVDEAAQLMEAEALLPISLAGPSTAVVMAGDPHQLGPTTFSKIESVHGLHCSIMERLAGMPAYTALKSAARTTTRLTSNYRSHPELVKMLGRISYSNTLQAQAPAAKVNALRGWAKSSTDQKFPMLLCSLEGGQEEREGDSPSWFNRQEAFVLLEIISDLLKGCEQDGLRQEDIGVITPYFKQTQKLRQLLRSHGLAKVKVGSTEEFHGHEVTALFISTVRTSPHNLDLDQQFDTGFVGNVKRFNTALSRAVALAVVVGDINVLTTAPEWRDMMATCRERKCFITKQAPPLPGLPPPPPANQADHAAKDAAAPAQPVQPAQPAQPAHVAAPKMPPPLPSMAKSCAELEAGFASAPVGSPPAVVAPPAARPAEPEPAAAAPPPPAAQPNSKGAGGRGNNRRGGRGGGRGKGGVAAPPAEAPPEPAGQMQALLGIMGMGAGGSLPGMPAMPAMPASAIDEASLLRTAAGASAGASAPSKPPEPEELPLAPRFANEDDEVHDDADEEDEDEGTPEWVEEVNGVEADEPSGGSGSPLSPLLPSSVALPHSTIEEGRADFLASGGLKIDGARAPPRPANGHAGLPPAPPAQAANGGMPGMMVPIGTPLTNGFAQAAQAAQQHQPANGHAPAQAHTNGFSPMASNSMYGPSMFAHGQPPEPTPPQPTASQPTPPKATPPKPKKPIANGTAERELLYSYEGAGVLYVKGPLPAYKLVEEEDGGIGIYISLFNLEYELKLSGEGLAAILTPDKGVLSSAAASHSFLHPTGETCLYIDVPDAFDGTKTVINEIETSQTLEIKLVKQAKKAPIQLKVNKVKR